jgi:hypothetical protein
VKRALVLLAACGDHRAAAPMIDAPPPAACTATYTGNVTEIATTDAPCTQLTGAMFSASIPSHALDAPLAIAIDLGTTASAGVFASATVLSWSADGVRTAAHEPCTYSGGSAVSPHGDFTLSLDGAHGTLTAHTYVLAAAFTDCGDPDTQTIVLAF